MQKLLISELLSSVSQSISEAEMKMFCLSEQSKSKFLPAISRILSQLQCLVSNNFLKMEVDVSSQSLSWDSDHNYPEYCEETTSISGDEERDVMSSTPDEERNVMKSIRKDEEDKFTASIKKAEDDKFITSMIMFIRTSSPNLVFSRSKSNKRRKRRLKKIVHSELLDVWSNFSEFVSPPKMSTPASSCSYPTVDWTSASFPTYLFHPSNLYTDVHLTQFSTRIGSKEATMDTIRTWVLHSPILIPLVLPLAT